MKKLEHKRDLKDMFFYDKIIVVSLRRHYISLDASHTAENFLGILKRIALNDDKTIEEPFLILKHFAKESAVSDDYIAKHPLGPIFIAATYLYRFKNCQDGDDFDLAWSYVADALYWTAYAATGRSFRDYFGLTESDFSQDEIMDMQVHAADKIVRAQGRKNKEKQDAPRIEIKAYAQKLALQQMPENGWNSLSQAVQAIKNDVFAFAETKKITMSPRDVNDGRNGRNTTIEKYLKELPDAAKLFNF